MAKTLIYSEECRKKLFSGIETVAKAVKATLGPCGRLVMIEREGKPPLVTKDGVTVAKYIELEDREENLGASLIKEVASKTNDVAGDNTTTSTVLAYAIIKEGLKAVASGRKPMELKRGIDAATIKIIKALNEMSKPVTTEKEITDVATVSANNDTEIGAILASAIAEVGKDGVITVEESNNVTTSVKVVKGMQFDKGYINPYFSTNKERLEVEYDDCLILVTDKKISSMAQILPILEPVAQSGKPLTIICDDMEGEALGTLILNAVRGSLKVNVVKAPSFGDNKRQQLEDIAIITGAKLIADEYGYSLEAATPDMLGKARVKSTKSDTTLTNGGGVKEEVEKRVEEIKAQIDAAEQTYDKDKLKARLAKLTGGVAVISIGAATETELQEKKFRVEDTIAATKAALAEGLLPGGGVALYNAGRTSAKVAQTDFELGEAILLEALKEPLKQIAENAGVNGEVVLDNLSKKADGFGYDAAKGEYCEMISSGIIDTTKAIKSALMNAASVAGMVLASECSITQIPKEQPMMSTPVGPMPM